VHYLSPEAEICHKLDVLMEKADIITVHVPLSDATKHLIGESALKKAKDGVVLLNFARKGIYDDAAILKSIESGKVGTYISDFPTRSLLGNPKVITTPHLGASTAESEENCAVMAVKQIRNYLEFGVVTNSVNFPVVEIFPQASTETRLVVINKDVPNMIADITKVLGGAGVNIQSLTNESNGKVGYNLIDTETSIPDSLVDAIRKLPGVLRVRVLRF
jgi:D-3-phosphoglycerate dehydrogenase / 2-oxoglutarate reductase